jgi:3-hydroxyisobutyrate dehydrogenase-like beta-hydroxyacid dehydrogenase
MEVRTIGVLHPGAMGAAVGAALRDGGTRTVLWAARGRSDATAHRAELADLVAVPDVAELATRSQVVVSICPPAAAIDVARAVARTPSDSLYLDANAVAPSTADLIAGLLGPDRFVDAAIIGPPPWRTGTTIVLSGTRAEQAASLFAGGPIQPFVVGSRIGQASAVKACFAVQSKALPAVWALIAAAAQHYGVAEPVRAMLAGDGVDLDAHLVALAARATAKAWRWDSEMDEAARAFADAGLPDGVSRAAAEVYRRFSAAVDPAATPDPHQWVDAVAGGPRHRE